MSDARLLLIGISQAHVTQSIERAQALGYEVVLGDSAENLAAKASMVAGADRLVTTDYTDHADLRRAAMELHAERPLDAIVTFKDTGAVNTALVARELGLRGNAPSAVAACDDKSTTRRLLAAAGFPGPRFAVCTTVAQLGDFAGAAGFPIVIKPLAQQGSIGVVRIESRAELPSAMRRCQEAAGQDEILAEEYVVGTEFSIEAMLYRGAPVIFGVTEKMLYPGSFVECGHMSPARVPAGDPDRCRAIVSRMTAALGLEYGPLHIEGFATADGFVPGEVHVRYGGDQIVQITESASQCDMTTPVFAELGEMPHDITFGGAGRPTGIRFLDVPSGTVRRVTGIEDARALPGVLNVEVSCRPGDTLKPVASSFDRIGWAVATAKDHACLATLLAAAVRKVEIHVDSP
jgi:biotin carboxylase